MNSSFFNTGQRFRQAVRVHKIAPHQYSALLHDIISDQPEIKPALLDLTTRKVFKELLMRGRPSGKILSKDRLLSELGPLYRDEIIAQLMAFIEGALDHEISTQSEVISTAQEQHVAYSPKNSEDEIPELGSFYADNPSRLLFLSIITFRIYTLLWAYRHWRHYKRLALISKPSLPSRQKDRHIAPVWCAFFQSFYIVGAARRAQARLEDLNIKHKPLRPWLVFCYSIFI
jgi:hypothetical protein